MWDDMNMGQVALLERSFFGWMIATPLHDLMIWNTANTLDT